MGTRICTFGSCVTRDIFHYTFPERYDVLLQIGVNPVSSILLSDFLTLPDHVFSFQTPVSNFYKKTICNQFRNNVVEQLLACQADYLILDFSDEYMRQYILQTQEKKIRLVDFHVNSSGDWFAQIRSQLTEAVPDFSIQEIGARQIPLTDQKLAYAEFLKRILRSKENPTGYDPKQVIILESYLATNYLNQDGKLQAFHSNWNVEKNNHYLKEIYQLVYQLIPKECHVIKYPDFTYGNYNHVWNPNPRHYSDSVYQYFADALDIITKHRPFLSTPEKLWKQQSLENRLAERLMHCSPVYEIAPLKKRLTETEQKLEQAMQQIESLTKLVTEQQASIAALQEHQKTEE